MRRKRRHATKNATRSRQHALLLLSALAFAPACSQGKKTDPKEAPAASTPTSTQAQPATSAAAAQNADTTGPCGEMPCELFDTPEQAFQAVLATKPLALGIGESHAQKGSEATASATKRFSDTLLPLLTTQATDLVLEVWVAEGKCGKEKEQKVAEQQKPVTQNQAKTNKNEYVALGDAAFAKGIKPHILRASCEDYDTIVKAGPDSVIVMLELIAKMMDGKVKAALDKNKKAGVEKIILTYGGAIHNDFEARKGREKWTFGPDLTQATGGRYVELDLVVPEHIQDNDAWRSLPWYPYFNKDKNPTKTTLLKPQKGSFVLVFPKS